MAIVCVKCGSITDRAVKSMRGSFLLECLLWLLFVLPGVIYSVWRLTTKAKVCPACGSKDIVPLSSPIGQRLQRELASPTASPAARSVPAASDMRCNTCGQQNRIGSAFCSACGTKVLQRLELTPVVTAVNPDQSPQKKNLLNRHPVLVVLLVLLALGWAASLAQRLTHRAVDAEPAPVAANTPSYTPPIEYYLTHSREHTRTGDTLTATLNTPCTPTEEELTDVTKSLERGDARQAAIKLLSTQSTFLHSGERFEVLALGVPNTKILILRTGKDCWVASEAVR